MTKFKGEQWDTEKRQFCGAGKLLGEQEQLGEQANCVKYGTKT